MEAAGPNVVIIEPFNGGSHAQLIKLLTGDFPIGDQLLVLTLPAKKWKWCVNSA
jgi:hypothetical protein